MSVRTSHTIIPVSETGRVARGFFQSFSVRRSMLVGGTLSWDSADYPRGIITEAWPWMAAGAETPEEHAQGGPNNQRRVVDAYNIFGVSYVFFNQVEPLWLTGWWFRNCKSTLINCNGSRLLQALWPSTQPSAVEPMGITFAKRIQEVCIQTDQAVPWNWQCFLLKVAREALPGMQLLLCWKRPRHSAGKKRSFRTSELHVTSFDDVIQSFGTSWFSLVLDFRVS